MITLTLTSFTKCSVRRRAEAFLFQEGWVVLRSFSLHPYFQARRYQKGFFFSPKTLMNNVISVTAGRALRKVGDGFRVSSNKNTQIPKPAIPPPTPWSVGVEDFKQTQECWVDLVSYTWSKGLGRQIFRFKVNLPSPSSNIRCYHTCKRQKCTNMWYTPNAQIWRRIGPQMHHSEPRWLGNTPVKESLWSNR